MWRHEAEVARQVSVELGHGVTVLCSSIRWACGRERCNLWGDHIHGMRFGTRLIERHIAIEALVSHPPLMGTVWYHSRRAMNKCKMLVRWVRILVGAVKSGILILLLVLLVLLWDLRRNLVRRLRLAFRNVSLFQIFFSRVFARGCCLCAWYAGMRSVALQLLLDASKTGLLRRSLANYSCLMSSAKMPQQDIVS